MGLGEAKSQIVYTKVIFSHGCDSNREAQNQWVLLFPLLQVGLCTSKFTCQMLCSSIKCPTIEEHIANIRQSIQRKHHITYIYIYTYILYIINITVITSLKTRSVIRLAVTSPLYH